MKRLNVFATEEEVQEIEDAAAMPYIMIAGKWPKSPLEIAHKYALKHGLPEIRGYYGCDLATREFISV